MNLKLPNFKELQLMKKQLKIILYRVNAHSINFDILSKNKHFLRIFSNFSFNKFTIFKFCAYSPYFYRIFEFRF